MIVHPFVVGDTVTIRNPYTIHCGRKGTVVESLTDEVVAISLDNGKRVPFSVKELKK